MGRPAGFPATTSVRSKAPVGARGAVGEQDDLIMIQSALKKSQRAKLCNNILASGLSMSDLPS